VPRAHEIAGSTPAVLTSLRWGLCWYGRAPVKRHVAGSIPATAAFTEGQANWRWQPPRKRPSDEPWGFDSLTFRLDVPLAERQRCQPSKLARRVRLPQGTLGTVIGDRLAVGPLALNQATEVTLPGYFVPAPLCRWDSSLPWLLYMSKRLNRHEIRISMKPLTWADWLVAALTAYGSFQKFCN
jgi:hypothetical protein